jgi:ketosteroid isomerase-like protein
MIRRRFVNIVLLIAVCLGSGAADTAGQPGDSEVIATERRALERWAKGDPDGFLEIYADEVTYFDPTQERLVEGLPAMKAYLAPLRGKIRIDRWEMLNAKVQRHGDVAVLTYNVVNYQKQPDGTERRTTRWNSTAVYRRIGDQWRTVHSHFSYTKPELK